MLPIFSLAVSSVAVLSTAPPPQHFAQFQTCHLKGPNNCTATNAATNPPPSNPETFIGAGELDEIQFVLPGAPGKRFYVTYSTFLDNNDVRSNNSVIFAFELACNQVADVLIFGTGYGCRSNTAGQYEFGPDTDAGLVNRIIRDCMRLVGNVKVAFVVPHGHKDHINPEFVHRLDDLPNYETYKIYVHADDLNLVKPIPAVPGCLESVFTAAEKHPTTGIFSSFGVADGCDDGVGIDPDCETSWDASALWFDTVIGRVWFRSRDGHTQGAVDLVLDYMGDEAHRYYLRGSAESGLNITSNECPGEIPACPSAPLPGVLKEIAIHGNVRLLDPVH